MGISTDAHTALETDIPVLTLDTCRQSPESYCPHNHPGTQGPRTVHVPVQLCTLNAPFSLCQKTPNSIFSHIPCYRGHVCVPQTSVLNP